MKLRWSIALAGAVVLFAGGAIATPAYADGTEIEPNDTMAKATVITHDTTVSGISHTASYSDLDYYAVDLPSAGRVKLNLRFPSDLGTGSAYTVAVYNSAGKKLYGFSLGGGDWNGSSLAGEGVFMPAGRFYVRIYGYDSWASWGKTYTLNVGWTPGTVEREPNDTTATATSLALGATVSGSSLTAEYSDLDYYAVDLPSASAGILTFRFPSNLGSGDAYTVTTYDPSGNRLDEFDLVGSDYNTTRNVPLSAGRNYIRIYGYDNYASWGKTYTLSLGYRWLATPAPFISGTARVGSTLTANPGIWSPAPSAYSYQWYRSGQALAGATTRTRVLTAGDLGSTMTVAVRGSKAGYPAVSTVSGPTGRVVAGTLSAGAPTISGTPKVGATLTAVAGNWGPSPVTLTYRWYRGGKVVAGATRSTYGLVAADRGKKISVQVTGAKPGFLPITRSSQTTKKIATGTLITAVPTITGSKVVGATLTAAAGKWGPAPVALSYRWYRNGKAISRATKATYRLAKADKGKKITVKVTGSKPGYSKAVRASAPTPKIA
ncbi:MAG TPA: hypothetical protein VGK17_02590 [Propionicimonas sp.]